MFQPSTSRRSIRVGWVIGLQVILLLAAVYVHVFSALPLAYSWGRTVELF